MSIELKTVMGQMNIVEGRWVNEAPNALAVREPSSRLKGGPPKGDLFVISEVRGDLEGSERNALNRALTETVRNTYYQSTGSVTASFCCEGFGLKKTDNVKHSDVEKRVKELVKLTAF